MSFLWYVNDMSDHRGLKDMEQHIDIFKKIPRIRPI